MARSQRSLRHCNAGVCIWIVYAVGRGGSGRHNKPTRSRAPQVLSSRSIRIRTQEQKSEAASRALGIHCSSEVLCLDGVVPRFCISSAAEGGQSREGGQIRAGGILSRWGSVCIHVAVEWSIVAPGWH